MDLPTLCCSLHKNDIEACNSCSNSQELTIGLIDLNKKLLDRKKSRELKIEKLKALITITQKKITLLSNNITLTEDIIAPQKGVSLSNFFQTLSLPQDFFTIVTREDLTIAFMVQSKFLPPYQVCLNCNTDMPITYFNHTGYVFYCFDCKSRNRIKNTTFFYNSPLTLEKILLFVFLWVLGIRDIEIANLLEVSKAYVSTVTRKIRQMVGKKYLESPPQFGGVVELDEMDFIKRKIEIGKSKAVKKWVLVMTERVTKQVYIEYIPERKREVIVPIIQKLCLPGAIIITKQWAGYGRLEDLGYCHYTYEKSQGFLNPKNPQIHHSNVKNSFTWLKYQIKTKNRSGNFLQEYILEWLWRKRELNESKADNTTISIFKSLLLMLAKSNS